MTKQEAIKQDIRIGVREESYTEENHHLVKHICSCGYKTEGEYINRRDIPHSHKCGNCGNKTFLPRYKVHSNSRVVKPTFFNINTSDRGFDVSRANLSIIYHTEEEWLEIIQTNTVRRMVFDWVDKVLKVYKNGELEYDWEKEDTWCNESRVHNHFMRGIDYNDFFEEIGLGDDEFYMYIKPRKDAYVRENKKVLKALRVALKNHGKYNCIQILSNAGYKNLLGMIHTIGNENNKNYSGSWRSAWDADPDQTKPHKILSMSKRMARYIKNSDIKQYYYLSTLKKISSDTEKSKKIYPILDIIDANYSLETFVGILNDLIFMSDEYNYDTKRLLEYLVDDLPMTQGLSSPINSFNILKDYVEMCNKMGIPFEKYPKSLKKEHDIADLNYKEYQKTQETEIFTEAVKENDYLLDTSNSEYNILLPESSHDLIVEGGELNHCVGSYVSSVKEGRTMIAFLRRRKEIEKPLVTIEVRNNAVRQARGKYNRGLTASERRYIKKWAESRNIYYKV